MAVKQVIKNELTFFTSSTTAARFHFTGAWNGTDQTHVFADTENTDFVTKLGFSKHTQQRCGLYGGFASGHLEP